MDKNYSSLSLQTFALAVLVPVTIGFVLLTDQSLSFPLGSHDQKHLGDLLREGRSSVEDSWVLTRIDGLIVRWVHPRNAFLFLDWTRRWMGLLALVGVATWVGRTRGWIRGMWVALLGIGLLPLRIVSTSLEPQAGFLFLFGWGCCLSLGKPWSKTGTAEQLGGGILLGLSVSAAPFGFLFVLPIPLRAILDSTFRKNLEQPFWAGLLVGGLTGLIGSIGSGKTAIFLGRTIAADPLQKTFLLGDLLIDSLGVGFLALLVIGGFGYVRRKSPAPPEAVDWILPSIAALSLGRTDPVGLSLAVPGLLLLSAIGLETLGKIFVARREQVIIPTALALVLSYHLFFSGMPQMRDRQSHAREVASLSRLILDRVPDGAAICLFRLNPMLDYLESVFPYRDWNRIEADLFRTSEQGETAVKRVVFQWVSGLPGHREIWVDPKRMGEPVEMGGIGKGLRDRLVSSLPNESYVGEMGAELTRFPIPEVIPRRRGKITTIRAPEGIEE